MFYAKPHRAHLDVRAVCEDFLILCDVFIYVYRYFRLFFVHAEFFLMLYYFAFSYM